MRSFIAAAAVLGHLSSLARAAGDNSSSSVCPAPGGVHMIVARGSLEPASYGILGAIKDEVIAAVPGSNAEAVLGVYEDTLADYQNSESSGEVAMRELISNFVNNCPSSPLILMGYSQGAQAAGDSLIGQVDQGFPTNTSLNTPLPDCVLSQVAAVVMMGDPTFNITESFHVGNATKSGVFPRQNVELFDRTGLSSRMVTYCDDDDLFCASGKSLLVHVGYIGVYGSAPASFAVSQLSSWQASPPTATCTPSSSSAVVSATATASGTVGTVGTVGTIKPSGTKPSASATGASSKVSASASASASKPSASAVSGTRPLASASGTAVKTTMVSAPTYSSTVKSTSGADSTSRYLPVVAAVAAAGILGFASMM